MFKSKIATHLVAGAVLVLVLLIAGLAYEYSITNSLYGVMKENVVNSKKMHIIASLIEVARARTRKTGEMLVVDDIFARDEISLELDKLASRFADLRLQLMELPLSDSDQALLKLQEEIVPVILTNQRRASGLAMMDDPEANQQAVDLLYTKVLPGQGKVIDYFMAMLNEAKDNIHDTTELAVERHRHSTLNNGLLMLGILVILLVVMVYVIRKVMQVERSLFIEKEQAQLTLSSIGDVVIITDKGGVITSSNKAFQRIFGKDQADMVNRNVADVFAGSEPALSDLVGKAVTEREHMEAGISLTEAFNGRNYYLTASVSPILTVNASIYGVVITIRDMTEQKKLSDHIAYQASYDQMTGLLNRHSFETFCRSEMQVRQPDDSHALAVIDLDRFKIINDTSGHAAGDEALCQIANIIRSRIRKQDRAARIGGDEFTVFLRDCDREAADAVFNGIRQMVQDYRLAWDDKVFTLGCSVGYVIIDQPDRDFTRAFQYADTACYLSKDAGRNRVTYLDMDAQVEDMDKEEVNWLPKIQDALNNDRFVLHVQPILPTLDSEADRLTREILIRLQDESGVILPDKFFASAERNDLIQQIDLYVLRKALAMLADDTKDVFCINLAAKTLASSEMLDQLFEAISEAGDVVQRLCLEVSETTLMTYTEPVSAFFNRVKSVGCMTALDDFGAGLSSFHYLEELPLNYIKIDGSLIQRVTERNDSRVMVESIHRIARTLNIKTIAESVDSEQLYETLKRMGIDCFQGFYLGRPYPVVSARLRDKSPEQNSVRQSAV